MTDFLFSSLSLVTIDKLSTDSLMQVVVRYVEFVTSSIDQSISEEEITSTDFSMNKRIRFFVCVQVAQNFHFFYIYSFLSKYTREEIQEK